MGENVRFPDGEYQVKEIVFPIPEALAETVKEIQPNDMAFVVGEGESQHTFIIDASEQLQVLRHDPLDTVLREAKKFINDALGEETIRKAKEADPLGMGPPLDSKGKVLPQYVPSMEMGGMLGLTALAWGMLKAIYECPDCPGHYRVPMEERDGCWRQVPYERAGDDSTWEAIACPHCQGLWTRKHEPGKVEQLALF